MPPAKPATADGYSEDHTLACERTLVTLLRGFGTLKHTLRLVGGLVPRYLTPARPPEVPAHAGTSDVDIVLNIQVLAEGEGYKALAKQLKDQGFNRALNDEGKPTGWRWRRQVTEHEFVVVEFLRDAAEELPAGGVFNVDGEKISALAIRHAGIVHDWYCEKEITAELLDEQGVATETIRFADVVGFIVLKALAFDDRFENKDAADLVHVMRYAGELDWVAARFYDRLKAAQHVGAIEEALSILHKRFCDGDGVEGHLRDGPVKCAMFAHGPGAATEEARALDQRNASGLVTEFLKLLRSMRDGQRACPEFCV